MKTFAGIIVISTLQACAAADNFGPYSAVSKTFGRDRVHCGLPMSKEWSEYKPDEKTIPWRVPRVDDRNADGYLDGSDSRVCADGGGETYTFTVRGAGPGTVYGPAQTFSVRVR